MASKTFYCKRLCSFTDNSLHAILAHSLRNFHPTLPPPPSILFCFESRGFLKKSYKFKFRKKANYQKNKGAQGTHCQLYSRYQLEFRIVSRIAFDFKLFELQLFRIKIKIQRLVIKFKQRNCNSRQKLQCWLLSSFMKQILNIEQVY